MWCRVTLWIAFLGAVRLQGIPLDEVVKPDTGLPVRIQGRPCR